MDADEAGWILEFCLRQKWLDDLILDKLFRVLPLPDHNLYLKKTLILRRIESEISKGRVSETILDLLEYIVELDRKMGVEVSAAMKTAYCAVAVDCTVRVLEECEDDDRAKYLDAVEKIWRGRVKALKRWKIDVVSESLNSWNRDIELDLWDSGFCENLVEKKNKSIDAVESVRVYVKDAEAKIGPPFLEVAADMLIRNKILDLRMSVRNAGHDMEHNQVRGEEPTFVHNAGHDMEHNQVRGEEPTTVHNAGHDMEHNQVRGEEPTTVHNDGNDMDCDQVRDCESTTTGHNAGHDMECDQVRDHEPTTTVHNAGHDMECDQARGDEQTATHNGGPDAVVNDSNIETHEEDIPHRSKHVGARRKYVARISRGAPRTSRGVKIVDVEELDDEMPTAVVKKEHEALETGALEPQEMVKDPLFDALQVAKSLMSSMARKNTVPKLENNSVDVDASRSSADGSAYAPQAHCRDKDNGPRFNLMARNKTAHTIEWDDSIDTSVEGSPSRPHLPSPKKSVVTPLQVDQISKLKKRRRSKPWSLLEEDTLRTGVQKYGKGSWKLILTMYRDIFEERTEVDLKDKWRNLTR